MKPSEAIEILSRPFSMQEAPKEILDAHRLAISALEKQEAIKSCTPPSDDWEHYADRLHDIAYQSGYEQGKKDAEQDRWRPCNEKPEYDFQNVLVRWHDKRKGCERGYYIFEGYVVRGIWCGLFEDVDISDLEPIEWKPLEPYYTEEES